MNIEEEVQRKIALRERILSEIRALLVEELDVQLAPEQIDPDTPLFGLGLGLDSVDAIELAIGLEERTGRKLPDGLTGRVTLRTVNGIIDFVLSQPEDTDVASA